VRRADRTAGDDGRVNERAAEPNLSFPRLSARTARFTCGLPRAATLTPDGAQVLFLRSRSGTDRTGLLWVADCATGVERLLADPSDVLSGGGEQLSAAERARRERSREWGAGIVSYAADEAVSALVFALSSRLFTVDVGTGQVRELPSHAPVIDPRPDPSGTWVAYATERALRVSAADGSGDRDLVGPVAGEAEVVWGRADFNAAEDMDRPRGFWWAPDSSGLLVERYDEAGVEVRWAADPADPRAEPARVRYPFAGTPNPDVQLWWVPLADPSSRVRLNWSGLGDLPYLTRVSWRAGHLPLVELLSRDHRRRVVVEVDPPAGSSAVVAEQHDDAWLEPVAGVPARAPDGRLLQVLVDLASDTYRLTADGTPLSPEGAQVEQVLGVDDDGALVGWTPDSVSRHLALAGWDGSWTPLTTGVAVATGSRRGGSLLVTRAGLGEVVPVTTVTQEGAEPTRIPDVAVIPPFVPRPQLAVVGDHRLDTALLLPVTWDGSASLPVLLDPYGGPGGARVLGSARAYLESQWWADQGFAVLVTDGRGTPGRGPASDRAIRHRLAQVTLDDQVAALQAVAAEHPKLDLSRVAIRGWSYGGYLAALAVLRRPDVFAAAVAGAPVTEHRLYSTFYTERYYGDPREVPEVYDANSLLPDAASLTRPLMLVHGLADDNVLVAHTLALSGALLAAGRPHTVLPLTGVTHMAADETVAENLLLLQLDFLRRALG